VAVQLAEGGTPVMLVASSIDQLDGTARQVKEFGGHAVTIPADLGCIRANAFSVNVVAVAALSVAL
jgi:short-subunit dehydrogenase